jgi:glycosyltransferase involved in cell wall biosynthesis
MDSKWNFYFFGNTRWSFFPHREHHIAVELAKRGYKVSFIEEVPSFAKKLKNLFFQSHPADYYYAKSVYPNLKIFTPYLIPSFFRSSLTPFVDKIIFRYWFKWKMFHNIVKPSVFFTTTSAWFLLLGDQIKLFDVIIYDVCDHLKISARNKRALNYLLKGERIAVKQSNIITCSSLPLYEKIKVENNINPVLIRNGVERNFINETQEPARSKIIGFIGVLDVKPQIYDIQLIIRIAKELPDYEIQIIGRHSISQESELAECKNIKILGIIPNQEIKERLRNFKVCIIPFRSTEVVSFINPLKLYEYLAFGKAVVATNNFDCDDAVGKEIINVANSREEFINQLKRVVEADSRDNSLKRIEYAKTKSWDERVDILLDALKNIQIT